MKTISPTLLAVIESGQVATLVKVTLTNGAVYGYTDHDAPLTVDGQEYVPIAGQSILKMNLTSDATVSTQDVVAAWTPVLSEQAVLEGLYDFAQVEYFLCSWGTKGLLTAQINLDQAGGWVDSLGAVAQGTVIATNPSYTAPVFLPKVPAQLYGFTLQSFWISDFQNHGEVLAALVRMKNQMGCNYVNIGFLYYSPTYTSNIVSNSLDLVPSEVFAGPFDTAEGAIPLTPENEPQQTIFVNGAWGTYYNFQLASPQTADITWAIEQAIALGFIVGVKPQLDFAGGMPWRAFAAPTTPGAPGTAGSWFDNYNTFIVAMATLAQAAGATYFFVGNENVSMVGTEYTTQWQTICANVRAVFSGKLIYAAASWNGPTEATTTGLWPYVDYCGFDFYPGLLSQGEMPSNQDAVAAALAGFTSNYSGFDYAPDFQQLATYSGKPLFFGEVGAMNWNGALYAPWTSSGDGSNNEAYQAYFFEALFKWMIENAATVPVFGMSIWLWRPFSFQSLPEDFTTWGKLAQDVIAKWFGGWQSATRTLKDGSDYNFEDGPAGFSDYPSGLTMGAATDVFWNQNPANAYAGTGSLGIDVDLQPTSSQYKMGQVSLLTPTSPQDVTGLYISANVLVPPGYQGSAIAPNAFRLQLFDTNYRLSHSGPLGAISSGWMNLTWDGAYGAYSEAGFDITKVIGFGISVEGDSYQPQPGGTLYGYAQNIPSTFFGNASGTAFAVSGSFITFSGYIPAQNGGTPGSLGFGATFNQEMPDGLSNVGAFGINLSDTTISVEIGDVGVLPSGPNQEFLTLILYDWEYNSICSTGMDLFGAAFPFVLSLVTPPAPATPPLSGFNIQNCIAFGAFLSNNTPSGFAQSVTIGQIIQAPLPGQAGTPPTLGPNNFSGTVYLDAINFTGTGANYEAPALGWFEAPPVPFPAEPSGSEAYSLGVTWGEQPLAAGASIEADVSYSTDAGVTWAPWTSVPNGGTVNIEQLAISPQYTQAKARIRLHSAQGVSPILEWATLNLAAIADGLPEGAGTTFGAVPIFGGRIGKITYIDKGFTAQALSNMWNLSQFIGIEFTANCRHKFGATQDPQGVGGCFYNASGQIYAGAIVKTIVNAVEFYVGMNSATPATPNSPNAPSLSAAAVFPNQSGGTQYLAPTQGSPYAYSVAAIVDGIESPSSPMSVIYTTLSIQGLPTFFQSLFQAVLPGNAVGSTITLNWNPVAGATAYNIYGRFNQTLLATVTGTTWTDNGSASGGTINPPYGDFFSQGFLTMTSGQASGLSREVKFCHSGKLQLWLPLERPVAVGDTFNVQVGCVKTSPACQYKFNNLINFGGFPGIKPQALYTTPQTGTGSSVKK